VTDHDNDKTRTHIVLTEGTMVSHYRILEKIGAGGMGEVFLAEDTKLKRQVALKFLPAHLITNDEVKSRFQREAQAVAKLNHPNIVTVHDVNEYNGRPYFVMEHVNGQPLHHFAHDEPLQIDQIIEYAIQICQGLGEAHRAGIVHRDIKAHNIVIDNSGRARLLDFGLAVVEGDDKLTKTGSTLGTVSYMSPEQVSGREIDHRSDLFSLGSVLYELIAGRTPFRKDNEGATLKAIIEDEPEPLARFKTDVPEKVQEIIFQLIEKDKELRYQSAEGVIADLKRLMYDSQQSSFKPEQTKKRNTFLLPISILIVLVVTVGIWALFFNGFEEIKEAKVPVLIVLPFENLGSDEDNYFSDGVTDEIRSRLSALEGVRIISRNSVEKFNNTEETAEEIGKELEADYLLVGTIRWDKSSDIERIRITPQLIQTNNNFQLWSKSYDKDLTQIFDVQTEIAEQIVSQLGLTFSNTVNFNQGEQLTSNMEAYNFYLKGLELGRQGIFVTNFQEVLALFDSAIALDPNFAVAWARKSIACTDLEFSSVLEATGKYGKEGKRSAEKALELAPNLPIAHIAMGAYYNFVERDYENAMAEFDIAQSEIVSNAELSEAIGVVKMRQGKWSEAIENFIKASETDPLNNRHYYWLATANSYIRDFSSARKYINRSFALATENIDAMYLKIYIDLLENGKKGIEDISFLENFSDKNIAKIFSWEIGGYNVTGLWRFFPAEIYPSDKKTALTELSFEEEKFNEHIKNLNIAELYSLEGHKDSAKLYFDSARITLSNLIENGSNDFGVYSALGITYARLEMFEEAIEAGETARELMSVDDCHW